jgi:hypothetical protein
MLLYYRQKSQLRTQKKSSSLHSDLLFPVSCICTHHTHMKHILNLYYSNPKPHDSTRPRRIAQALISLTQKRNSPYSEFGGGVRHVRDTYHGRIPEKKKKNNTTIPDNPIRPASETKVWLRICCPPLPLLLVFKIPQRNTPSPSCSHSSISDTKISQHTHYITPQSPLHPPHLLSIPMRTSPTPSRTCHQMRQRRPR